MKHRLLQTIVALVAIAGSAAAQTLSIAPVEIKMGEQLELVVTASGMSNVTALQFNLVLPTGLHSIKMLSRRVRPSAVTRFQFRH